MNTDVLHNIDRYLESVPAFKWEYYHDLESLLYVLVGICVTRAGPVPCQQLLFRCVHHRYMVHGRSSQWVHGVGQ